MNYTKELTCGCLITISGFEGNIIYCSKHKAAPDMYEALGLALKDLAELGRIDTKTEIIMVDAKAKAEGREK
jgi:hypothetical protein